MKRVKLILTVCVSVFISENLSAQEGKNKPFECSNKEVKVCPDTIIGKTEYSQLQRDTADLKKQVINLTIQLQKPDIDKFLNIQDTAIFGSEFLKFPLQSIPARSRDFYLLIENIHDLNNLLANTENMTVAQSQKLKDNLVVAKTKIDLINSFATLEKRKVSDFLTDLQKQYYRQLVARYNELNEMFNFNSSESGNEH
jgi:hypothetical protein